MKQVISATTGIDNDAASSGADISLEQHAFSVLSRLAQCDVGFDNAPRNHSPSLQGSDEVRLQLHALTLLTRVFLGDVAESLDGRATQFSPSIHADAVREEEVRIDRDQKRLDLKEDILAKVVALIEEERGRDAEIGHNARVAAREVWNVEAAASLHSLEQQEAELDAAINVVKTFLKDGFKRSEI